MPIYIYLHRVPAIRLWGLSYQQRVQRQFQQHADIQILSEPEQLAKLPAQGKLICIDGQWLLGARLLQSLIDSQRGTYHARTANKTVALICDTTEHEAALACLTQTARQADEWPQFILEDQVSNVESRLRKLDPPLIKRLDADQIQHVENALYGSAYKSVTDLITKWLWPKPARVVTHWCATLGIRPNHVTVFGLLLMLLAGWLFYQGEFGWGLFAGWIMTFLDTVDGKLARVTITSSKIGNALDHGMDLVHPPFWYMLWGMGLAHTGTWVYDVSLPLVYILIFAGYIFGRLAEGCFEWLIGSFSLFTWRPFDSFNRLITARRNPCMVLLTAGWISGHADLGLIAVLIWTLFSTLLLWLRNAQAWLSRRQQPLESWLVQANQGEAFSHFALKVFAPHALVQKKNH